MVVFHTEEPQEEAFCFHLCLHLSLFLTQMPACPPEASIRIIPLLAQSPSSLPRFSLMLNKVLTV